MTKKKEGDEAKKLRTIITKVDEPIVDDAEEEVPPEDDIGTFVRNVGGDAASVKVYRIEGSRMRVVASDVPPAMCTEGWLQLEHGEGTYQVRLVDSQGNYIKSKQIYVGPPGISQQLEIARKRAELKKISNGEVMPSSNGNNELQLQLLREELNSQRQIMVELIRALAVKNESAQPSATSVSELAQVLQLGREMSNPASQLGEIINVFKQGLEIGASGGVPEKPMWMTVVEEIGKVLPAIVKPAVKPSDIPAASAAEQIPVQAGEDMSKVLLRQGIAYLKGRAERGTDPGLWVDVIVQNLDEPQWKPFVALLEKPYEEIASIDPDLSRPPYQQFFRAIYDGVKQALSETNNEVQSS